MCSPLFLSDACECLASLRVSRGRSKTSQHLRPHHGDADKIVVDQLSSSSSATWRKVPEFLYIAANPAHLRRWGSLEAPPVRVRLGLP
jgi:hypothetical protein